MVGEDDSVSKLNYVAAALYKKEQQHTSALLLPTKRGGV